MCIPDTEEMRGIMDAVNDMADELDLPHLHAPDMIGERVMLPDEWSEPPKRLCACGAEFQYGAMCESCREMQRESGL
jgi:hypothetical protein